MQPTALEIFRNILVWCGVIVKQYSYMLIFQKNYRFGLGAIRAIIMQIYTHNQMYKYFAME